MSLVQGGSGFPFFSQSLYDYICGKDVCSIQPTFDEIPDTSLKTTLTQVNINYAVHCCVPNYILCDV